jgi:metal-responsive CopG/Arc/MetJ family transcriptional regulator
MPAARRQYEVVSVSLPRDLVKRANAVIPKARRSRVITSMLTAFLDSVARKQLEHDYAAYYNQRSDREAKEERELLSEWKLSDQEAWEILEAEEASGRRKAG